MTETLLTLRVARKRAEALDIMSFDLVDPAGAPLPAFTAGAHIDVHGPGGLVRQYSLCNDPRETSRYRIAVLRDAASRGGSDAMHAQVREGDLLKISPPRNHFELAPDAAEHLLLGAGIGITPLLAMAEHLSAQDKPFELAYCTRSAARTAFADHLAHERFGGRVRHFHGDSPERSGLDLAALLASPRPGLHLYVCGPKGFIDAALAAAAHWPAAQVHREFFGAAAPVQRTGDEAFEIELASSGRRVHVGAEQTVLEALRGAGIELASSCEQGVCGTCLTRVLAGVPDHRDQYLTPEEQAGNDQFLPCCSRSCSAVLVVDL
jgi:vanillate O-demethylase ferredoxin subunit